MSAFLVSVFLFLCLVAAQSRPDLDARLEKIDRLAGDVQDLRAAFVQKKFSALLKEPLITRGEVRTKGGVMLWESAKPEPIKTRASANRLEIYYVKRNTVEEYPIQGQLGELATSPLPRLASLRTKFSIAEDSGEGLEGPKQGTVALKLLPLSDDLAKYVGQVRVLLDEGRGLVLRFELTDPDGERTLIAFDDVKTNAGISDVEMGLGAPKNVKIVRPLEPGAK